MTGFGRSAGRQDGRSWSWELRSVNARGLDLRLKLPSGWEAQEPAFKQMIAERLARGAVQAQLTWVTEKAASIAVQTDVLDRLVSIAADLAARIQGAPPPRAEALLALPGVLQSTAEPEAAADAAYVRTALEGLQSALDGLNTARLAEGARLGAVLGAQIGAIAALAREARDLAAQQPAAQQSRLAAILRDLLGGETAIDPSRLAQEVALLASRSDVREELDRLDSHVAEARALLAHGRTIGRRLDFLAQEFMREANTLCSKSATTALTSCGLHLKAAIEQLREQVQNVE